MNTVPRLWPDSTIAILASGPSLTREDVEFCRGRARTIVIKETVQLAPWADVFYAPDKKFFEYNGHEGTKMLDGFAGLRFTLDHFVNADVATYLQIGDRRGLSLNPTTLNTGYDSGFACINLAVLLGASRVVLLGYDMKPGPNGESHAWGEHSWRTRPPFALMLPEYPSLVEPLRAAGVTVINATKDSALACFPYQPLAEALATPAEAAA
jgi:hypothetical protein